MTPKEKESTDREHMRRLTKYVTSGGKLCPYCESFEYGIQSRSRYDIEATSEAFPNSTDDKLFLAECLNPSCGKKWYDHYTLFGVREVNKI